MFLPDLSRYFRFLSELGDSLIGLARYTYHTYSEVKDLVPGMEPEQLVRMGVLRCLDETKEYFLDPNLAALVQERSRTRLLSSSRLTQFHVRNLVGLQESISHYLKTRNWEGLDLEVEGVTKVMMQLEGDILGNLDAIRRMTTEFRTGPLGGAKKRLATLKAIWDQQMTPMEEVFAPRGPLEESRMALEGLLERAEEDVPDLRRRAIYRFARHLLRKLIRSAAKAYQDAYFEIRPLYNEAKRNEELARAASGLLAACFDNLKQARPLWALRRPGEPHALDGILGVQNAGGEGEDRFFAPFPQQEMIKLLVERIYGYHPAPQPIFHPPTRKPRAFQIVDVAAHGALLRARREGPVEDVMAWLTQTYPKASPSELIRAYGAVVMHRVGVEADPTRLVVHRLGTKKVTAHPLVGRAARKAV